MTRVYTPAKDDEPPAKVRGGVTTKASRLHLGQHHWHVEIRSTVIICRACDAKIPRNLKPKWCPACGAGKVG
jgi:hypothetical protein